MPIISDDAPIYLPTEEADFMSLDEAIEIASVKLGLPLLGGPSGKGWSLYSTAQRCGHLFHKTISVLGQGQGKDHQPAEPLQIGGLYHALQALFYAPGLGQAVVKDRGIISASVTRRGRPATKLIEVPPDAADQLLTELRRMAEPVEEELRASVDANAPAPPKRPNAEYIEVAAKCFDAHTDFHSGKEDATPLAIEWLATNEKLQYTCRYDKIVAVGADHFLVDGETIKPGAIVIHEYKTAAWLSDVAKNGWRLDGEILGEILNWKPGGCEEMFGPLAAVVVDIVTKTKVAQLHQIVIPATAPAVADHARWLRYQQGEIALWQATEVYPKRFSNCVNRWGLCNLFDECARGE